MNYPFAFSTHSRLESRVSPGEMFQSLLAPQRLTSPEAVRGEIIDLPALGSLKFEVWRGIVLAVPPSPASFNRTESGIADRDELALLNRWAGVQTATGLMINRSQHSSSAVVNSTREAEGFRSGIKLVASRYPSRDPQLDSIDILVEFNRAGCSGSLHYFANRNSGSEGSMVLQGPAGRIKLKHGEKAVAGANTSVSHFNPTAVIAKLLALNENPSLIARPREVLINIGVSPEILDRAFSHAYQNC